MYNDRYWLSRDLLENKAIKYALDGRDRFCKPINPSVSNCLRFGPNRGERWSSPPIGKLAS